MTDATIDALIDDLVKGVRDAVLIELQRIEISRLRQEVRDLAYQCRALADINE